MSHKQIPPAPVYYSSCGSAVSAGAILDPLLALAFEAAVSQLYAVLPFEDADDDMPPDGDVDLVERLAVLEERLAQVEAAIVASGHVAPASLPRWHRSPRCITARCARARSRCPMPSCC